MAIYRTKSGYGVDWRDAFNQRHRKFVGTLQAAETMLARLRRDLS